MRLLPSIESTRDQLMKTWYRGLENELLAPRIVTRTEARFAATAPNSPLRKEITKSLWCDPYSFSIWSILSWSYEAEVNYDGVNVFRQPETHRCNLAWSCGSRCSTRVPTPSMTDMTDAQEYWQTGEKSRPDFLHDRHRHRSWKREERRDQNKNLAVQKSYLCVITPRASDSLGLEYTNMRTRARRTLTLPRARVLEREEETQNRCRSSGATGTTHITGNERLAQPLLDGV